MGSMSRMILYFLTEPTLGNCLSASVSRTRGSVRPTEMARPWILARRTDIVRPCSRKISAYAIEADHLDPLL